MLDTFGHIHVGRAQVDHQGGQVRVLRAPHLRRRIELLRAVRLSSPRPSDCRRLSGAVYRCNKRDIHATLTLLL
eukprot:3084149-Pyramimonas_sp.AAC.1